MATLRELFLKVFVDSKPAIDGLEAVNKEADKSAKALADVDKKTEQLGETFHAVGGKLASGAKVAATAFAGATTAVALFFEKWAASTVQIERTAKAYGLSTDALQELSYAAEKLGGEGDAVVEVFKEMAIRITEVAETGSGPATDALTYLKLKAEDLKKLSPEKQFDVLADAISRVSDEGTKFFLKDSLFGEEGSIKIGTLLDRGSTGIAKLRGEAKALGVVLDRDAIKQGNELRATLFTIHKTAEGLLNQVLVRLAPTASAIAEKFAAWAQANRGVLATRIEGLVQRLLELVEKLGPALGTTVDNALKLSDAVGGIDKAIIGATGAWAAFQTAGTAALQAVARELTKAALAGSAGSMVGGLGRLGLYGLALGGGAAAGAFIANRLKRGREQARDTSSEAAAAEFGDYAKLALAESEKEQTYDPGIDNARQALIDKVKEADRFRVFSGSDVSTPAVVARRQKALAELDSAVKALDEAYASDEAHRLATEQEAFVPGKIKQPGKDTESLATILRDIQKEDAERARRQKILDEIESGLRKDGQEFLAAPYRMDPEVAAIANERKSRRALERARSRVIGELASGGELTLNQLIAQAVGQDTGLGGTALRPAGLGTTINHIDASIRFEVGGVTVEVPAGMAAAYNGAVKLGGDLSDAIRDALQPMLDNAFRAQRGQIIG